MAMTPTTLLAIISQCILSSIAISKPIFFPPQPIFSESPTDRETSHSQKVQMAY